MRFKIGLLFLLMAGLLPAQSTQILLDQALYINPAFPLTITGTFTIGDNDTLNTIQWAKIPIQNWAAVDSVDTTAGEFSHSLPTQVPGSHRFVFRLKTVQNQTAKDTLRILVDHSPPSITDITVSRPYLSNAHLSLNVTLSFNESVNTDSAVIRLFSETNEDSVTIHELNLNPDSSILNFDVFKDDLPNPANWEGQVAIRIKGISDIYGNGMQDTTFNNAFRADFTNPSVADYQIVDSVLTLQSDSAQLDILFNEPVQTTGYSLLLRPVHANYDLPLSAVFKYNNTKIEITISRDLFSGEPAWEDSTRLFISGFKDIAGNSLPSGSRPAILVDLKRPEVTHAESEQNFINLSSQPLNVSVSFHEKVRDSLATFRLYAPEGSEFAELGYSFTNDSSILISEAIEDSLFLTNPALWQGRPSLRLTGFADTLGNVMQDTLFRLFGVDVEKPVSPRLTGSYPYITTDSVIAMTGRKEYKATLFCNDSTLSAFTDTTRWSFTVPLKKDSLYVFRFWQIDSLYNGSDTSRLAILVDRMSPRLDYSPPLITLKFDTLTLGTYLELSMFFNEVVSINSTGNLKLFTHNNQEISLQNYQDVEQGATHRIAINNTAHVEQILNWFSRGDSVFLEIAANTLQDLAGNSNAQILKRKVMVRVENYVTELISPLVCMSPDGDGNRDTLTLDIALKPGHPNKLLLQINVRNTKGERVFLYQNLLDFSNDISIDLEEGRLYSVTDTTTNQGHLTWKWSPENLPDGKYRASISGQEFYQGIASVPQTKAFWIDRLAPEIVKILPVTGQERHYIGPQPDFMVEVNRTAEEAGIEYVKIWISQAFSGTIGPVAKEWQMTQRENSNTFQLNCRQHDIRIDDGTQRVRFTVADLAGNSRSYNYVYYVTGEKVRGISDIYNFPNPFNPRAGERTVVSFSYTGNSEMKFYVYDISSRLVYYQRLDANAPGGSGIRKNIFWNGRDLTGRLVANGVYFVRIVAGSEKSDILKVAVNNH